MEALTARVAELEARVRQDSSNASKPPSSDGPGTKCQLKRLEKGALSDMLGVALSVGSVSCPPPPRRSLLSRPESVNDY